MSPLESARTKWINFREIREKLQFSNVLSYYKVKLKEKGARATGPCPLPTHEGRRKSSAFSADLSRGIWQCFGCHAKGNVLDFVCRMERFNPGNPHELREGALRARDIFLGEAVATVAVAKLNDATVRSANPAASTTRDDHNVLVNAPMDFELQTLDFEHHYLRERGFTDETIRYFGLGFCNRGMLKHRIAIPVHDPRGRLVGYAGRLVEERLMTKDNPKYRFPGDRERDGTLLQFRKSLLVYNIHRISENVSDLIVVEGFPSVWWLHQHGYAKCVALMGNDCSEEQASLILAKVDWDGRIWLMPDGGEGGKLCAESLLRSLSPYRFVRWLKLNDEEQPTSFGADELEAMLTV